MTKNKPEIRFSSFESMWIEQKFDNVLKSHSSKPYLTNTLKNGKYPIIQQGENPLLGFSDGEPFENYGDVILFGDHTLSVYKPKMPFFVATDGVKILSAKGIDGIFLTPLFEKYVPKSQGYKRHYTILRNEFISYPLEIEEQTKIGTFFKNLDDTISLHQQELEALKQTKQGFLQKMFPKDGEKVPQIRFNEFSEPWTQIEFGKVIKLVGGATPLKENKEYWNGDIVWLSSQEVKNKYVSKGTYLITEQAVKDNRTKVVSEGTPLIVTRSGILAKRFPISISLNEVAINQDIKALIFDRERFDTEFIVAEIKSKELYILNNIVKTGTTVQSVNLPDLNRMNLHIPEYAEQLKIGKFFRELDEVIDLKEKELEALKETKKGFLQKMFV